MADHGDASVPCMRIPKPSSAQPAVHTGCFSPSSAPASAAPLPRSLTCIRGVSAPLPHLPPPATPLRPLPAAAGTNLEVGPHSRLAFTLGPSRHTAWLGPRLLWLQIAPPLVCASVVHEWTACNIFLIFYEVLMPLTASYLFAYPRRHLGFLLNLSARGGQISVHGSQTFC